MTEDEDYELIEESIAAVWIGEHQVMLQRARYESVPAHQWHAYCTEYFGESVSRGERVRARDTSFYVAAAKAVDAYANSGADQESNPA